MKRTATTSYAALAFALAVAALCASATQRFEASTSTLVVDIEGLRNTEGSVHVGFYDSEAQWMTEKSNFQRHGSKRATSADGKLRLTLDDVPAGHYAVAIVDDENDNGHIDWGILLPKEGFGFSNYYHRGLFRPEFDDFDFDLPPGQTVTVTIRVKYL